MDELPELPVVTLQPREDATYVFDAQHSYNIKLSDFIGANLRGELVSLVKPLNVNFENCLLTDFNLRGILLHACDFLDTNISRSSFERCNFDQSHFSGCHVSDTAFRDCRLYLTNHTDTVFVRCVFRSCQFERFIFKYCRFLECTFEDCETTNRLFDTCTIFDCTFERVELQVSTLLTNLGLQEEQFTACRFRLQRSYEDAASLSIEEVRSLLAENRATALQRVSIAYFLGGHGLLLHEMLISLFEDIEWLETSVSKTISDRLTAIVSFVFYLYDKGSMMTIVLFRLQDFLNRLSQSIDDSAKESSLAVGQTIDGLRLQAARQLQPALNELEVLSSQLSSASSLSLEGEGPIDPVFFQSVLGHLDRTEITVIAVRPRNSPVIIEIDLIQAASGIWIAAAVVATRFKYEVANIRSGITVASEKLIHSAGSEREIGSHAVTATQSGGTTQHFEIQAGFLDQGAVEVGVQAVAVFSSGMCHKLHLGFSIERAFKIHKHILSIMKIYRK